MRRLPLSIESTVTRRLSADQRGWRSQRWSFAAPGGRTWRKVPISLYLPVAASMMSSFCKSLFSPVG